MERSKAVPPPKAKQERRWIEENRQAISTYNLRVATHGLLSDHAGLLRTD
jgi:post-segregation antitoxin (ccd killing protein)